MNANINFAPRDYQLHVLATPKSGANQLIDEV